MIKDGKKGVQGTYYYADPEIEKWRYNAYRKQKRILADARVKNHDPGEFPLHLIIEVTSVCNMNCVMCNRNVMTRKQTFLPLADYKKIIDEAVENGVMSISLYALGEPMLHKNIREMISYAKRMGIPYVDLSTNAMIDMRPLLGTGLNEMIVSIDGDEKTFSSIRIGGNYKKVVENLNNFIQEQKEGRYDYPLVRLQVIDFQPPKYDVDKLIEEWLGKVDVVYKKNLEAMSQSLGDNVLDKKAIALRNEGREPCKQLYHTMTINADGTIAYCCHDPYGTSVVGNIKENTLKDCWKKIDFVRWQHQNKKYNAFCDACSDWKTW
jgi:radical SAM protein with 4Fe4S-binding SPASM domain